KALRGIFQFEPSDDLRFTFTGNWADSTMATGPYQSKPTTPVYDGGPGDPDVQLSTGELVNVINTSLSETRRSICGDGITDCGSDQDNNGFPDDLDGIPGLDTGRINNQFQLTPGGDFFGYRDPDGDDWTFSSDFAFEDSGSMETYGLAFRVEWDLSDSTTLTALTDFKDYEKLLFIDVDSAPVNQSANYAGVDATSLTQEVRLSGSGERTRWVAGVFYLNIDNTSMNGLKFPSNSVVPGPFDLGSDADLETNSYSLFGQGEYDLTETLTLVTGARFIVEDKDYVFSQNIYFAPDPRAVHQGTPTLIGPTYPGGTPTAYTDSRSDNLWAGKIQLDWRPTDDWLIYGGINRGVKAGSYNAQLAGGLAVPDSAIPYDEEVLLSYETGFKSTWMDGRTRLNGSVFYYDYSDHQAFLFTGVGGVVVNSDADTIGAELEIQTSPLEGMDILLSGSWFDATIKDVPLRVDGPITRDVDPTFAPEVQLAGLIRYEWALFGGLASVQGDFSYSDSFYYNLRNFDADQFDSYTLLNARVGWATADETLSVALNLRNLSDEKAGIHGYDLATLCGCNEVSYRPPRFWGMNVKYSF
ncbi:MAG: TonB-dependent receptor, partial [Gammaproteobacteria bacterium]|nr:TonB-dependent receptor [Gammaproteobacteria bacterium]